MISTLLGGNLNDSDLKQWMKDNGKLTPTLHACEVGILKQYMRRAIRSTQKLSKVDPITGKRQEGRRANDPMLIHFDDNFLLGFRGDDGIRRGFSRLASFIEPAVDLGLNLRVLIFNRHHDLIEWFDKGERWPSSWPEPSYISE